MIKDKKKTIPYILLSVYLFLFSLTKVFAVGSATVSVSANSSKINVGDSVNITVGLKNIVGAEPGVSGFQATLVYDATILNCSKGSKISPEDGFRVSFNSSTNKMTGFAGDDSEKIPGSAFSLVRISCTALKEGVTGVTVRNHEVSAGDGSIMNSNAETVNIQVVTSTPVTPNNPDPVVPSNPDPVAPSNPSGGINTPSGGNNGGSTSPNNPSSGGNTPVVSTGSNNNYLASLKIEGANLRPGFNQNTLNYEVSVPFSVENINVEAKAKDSKAKVSISNQNNLVAGETRNVTVKVTAENGSVRTYTIKVTRESDPNKVQSSNNYLSSITTDVGMLSPLFDKEKTKYYIYLPYEIEGINLLATAEDGSATINSDLPETLEVGYNKFVFTVVAENGEERVYTINVIRANNPELMSEGNLYLKSINIKKGSLDKKFNKDTYVYYYIKSKGFELEALPLDENNKVEIFENDGVISIIVEDSFNKKAVYTLIPKEEVAHKKEMPLVAKVVIGASVILICSFVSYIGGSQKVLAKLVRKIRKK